MRARLTVTSDQRQSLGAEASRDFQETGGFLGRSATCDWRLPDPTHTVSARHAEIRFNGHGFVVVDLSTNGVYVNTTDAPLGRGNSAVLVSGDTLYVGVYVIAVEILRTAAVQPPREASTTPPARDAFPAAAAPTAAAGAEVPWQAASGRPAAAYRSPDVPRPIDPLAALDGAESAPEGDNPFQELGLIRKSGETTTGWRDLLDSRSRPTPTGPEPRATPPLPTGSVIPSDFAVSPAPGVAGAPAARRPPASPASATPASAYVPPAPMPPPPDQRFAPPVPAPAFAPAPFGPLSEGGIPADFLDELSVLIPQLSLRSSPPAGEAMLRPPGAEAPLSIARGVSARPAGQVAPSPSDPVSLLRQRAAARGGVSGDPVARDMTRPPAALALGDGHALPPREVPTPVPAAMPPLPPSLPDIPAANGDPAEPLWALLGVDGQSLSPQARARVFTDVAGLLREMADGLVSVLEARRLIKDGFNLDRTQLRPVENNPFKFCSSGREALDKALVKRPPGFLAPADAARAGFDDVKVHEIAAMEAMQATIARLLQRISPAAVTFELEGEAAANASLFGRKLDKGRLWDRYLAMHERLVDALDVISPEVVGEEFARAYAQHSQDLRRKEP